MILYFSGTGNSEYAARKIAAVAGDEMQSLNNCIRNNSVREIESEKPLVFVTPTYAWRIPRLVEKWIDKASFKGNKKAYFVMTCGEDNGNAQKYVKRLCVRNGLEYMGCVSVVMPENYVAMFPVPGEKEARAIVKAADPLIERTAARIREGRRFGEKNVNVPDKIKSSLVNIVFYPFCVKDKRFTVDDTCIACGKCEKLCPLNNVKIVDNKPVWGGNCTHCMACICGCPKGAVEYGNMSRGKPRYHVPE